MFTELLELSADRKNEVLYYFVFMAIRGFLTVIPLILLFQLVLAVMDNSLNPDSLILISLCFIVTYLVINILDHNLYLKTMHLGYRLAYVVREMIEEKLSKLPLHFYTKRAIGTQTMILGNYASKLEIGVYIINLIVQYAVAAVTIVLYFFILDWRLALSSLITAPLIYLAYRQVNSIMGRIHAEKEHVHRKFSTAVIEFIQGMPVVRIFNQQNSLTCRFSEDAREYRDWNIKMIKETTGPSLVFILFLSLDIVIILPVGFYLASLGLLDFRILIFFIIAVPILTDSLYHSIYPYVEQRFSLEEGYEQIQDLMQEPNLITAIPERIPSGYDIEFKHVSFSYGDNEVISDLSFSIKEGSITAIVGPSGAGKTTITNLLTRFWDVQSGEILIGGANITHIPMDILLSGIAMVFQDVVLFNDSIMENIRIGNPHATDDEVINAAQAAQCESFIREMTDGYQTILGERGARLSEGQKQRISIARAILKNAPILILEEATVYVDPNNEFEIQEALSRLIKGKTVLVIAHRMSVIAGADQIIVIKDGSVLESGNHVSLIEKGGMYRNFWDAQEKARHWHL
jgi:ATP-binding cassette subfamily B protein IrtB